MIIVIKVCVKAFCKKDLFVMKIHKVKVNFAFLPSFEMSELVSVWLATFVNPPLVFL